MAWGLFLCIIIFYGCVKSQRVVKAYQVEVSNLNLPPFSLAIMQVDQSTMVSTKGLLVGMDPLLYIPAENIQHEDQELTFVTPFGVVGKLFPLQWSARILSKPNDNFLKIELTNKSLVDGKTKGIYILKSIDPQKINALDPAWRSIMVE